YIHAHGVDAFRQAVDHAQALSAFMLSELAQRHSLDEPEGRAACIHEARPLLALMPESAIRVQIQREFARHVLLTPEELAAMLVEHSVSRMGQGAAGSSAGVHQGTPVDRSTMPWPDDAGAIPADLDDIGGPPPYYDEGPAASHGSAHFAPDNGRASSRKRDIGAVRQQRSGSGVRRMQQRAVTPMAKRLLRLLLAHPGLVEHVVDQQLEILDNSPHMVVVRD